MLQRALEPNHLQRRVEANNLGARRAQWVPLDENQAADFPILTLEYIRNLCYGIYQVNLAPGYIQDKLQREANDVLQFDQNRFDPNLIRVRVCSRFSNAGRYQLYITYNNQENNHGPSITGYYCTCKSGARTLGTCAHVASVIWFLGYARHQDNVDYPSTSLFHHISDAGNRDPPNENVEII